MTLRDKLICFKLYLTRPHVMQIRYVREGVKHLVVIERLPFNVKIVGRYTVDETFRPEREHASEEIEFPGQIISC